MNEAYGLHSYCVESIGTVNEQAVAKYIDSQRLKEREPK